MLKLHLCMLYINACIQYKPAMQYCSQVAVAPYAAHCMARVMQQQH
jgi:hypothetical protein